MDFKEASKPISAVGVKDVGILVCHGISSTPGTLAYVSNKLIEAGYHVEVPLLPGHGQTWESLGQVTRHDWLAEVERAEMRLRSRCKKVFGLGLSLGGGLLLRREALGGKFDGLIMINHLCVVKGLLVTIAPVFRHILRAVPGVASDIKDKAAGLEPAYKWLHTTAGWEAILLSKEIQKSLPVVKSPLLIFKSTTDHVVPRESATYTMERVGSKTKRIVWLENSYHVATMDYDKDNIVMESIKFIEAVSNIK